MREFVLRRVRDGRSILTKAVFVLTTRAMMPIPTSSDQLRKSSRRKTGFEGFDRLLGGGLPTEGVVVIAGDPGAGKSRWLMQLARNLGPSNCLLIATSEPIETLMSYATRMGIKDGLNGMRALAPAGLEAIKQQLQTSKQSCILWDSVNKLGDEERSYQAVAKRMAMLAEDVRSGKRLHVVISEMNKAGRPAAFRACLTQFSANWRGRTMEQNPNRRDRHDALT